MTRYTFPKEPEPSSFSTRTANKQSENRLRRRNFHLQSSLMMSPGLIEMALFLFVQIVHPRRK